MPCSRADPLVEPPAQTLTLTSTPKSRRGSMVRILLPLLAGLLVLPIQLSGAASASDSHAAASTYSSAVLADAPAGYWRLGESSGTTAADSAGHNAGTYVGGVTLGQAGALSGDSDTSVVLDGSIATVQIPDAAALDPTTQITLEAWIKPSALTGMILRKDSQYLLSLSANGSVAF